MKEHEFTLKIDISGLDLDECLDKLAEDCNDSLCGIGIEDQISMEFIREAKTRNEAIKSAINNINKVLKDITFLNEEKEITNILKEK